MQIIEKTVTDLSDPKTYFNLFQGTKTVQIIGDNEGCTTAPRILHFEEVDDNTIFRLREINENGAGIHMAINLTDGKGRKNENVIKVRSVFADLDGSPLGPALGLSPTLIVESSSGKYHCYWFTEDTSLEAFPLMQQAIAYKLKGDSQITNLSRTLRVPGFYHRKNDLFLSVIRAWLGTVYTYRELVGMFPPVRVKKWTAPRYQDKGKADRDKFKGDYGTGEGGRHYHIIKRVGGMIKSGKSMEYITQEIYKEGASCSPPLAEFDIKNLIKSAERYYNG